MIKNTGTNETWAASECRVIIAYEGNSTRDRAMTLVRQMEKRFDAEIDFSCTWWKFRFLMNEEISMIARHYAASADIVIFSSDAPDLFPLPIMQWIESWTTHRSKDGGVMVPLIGSPNIPQSLYLTKRFYLRRVAERAGLDYIPHTWLLPDDVAASDHDPSSNLDLSISESNQTASASTSISSP